jgi:hypothetical protein
VRGRCEDGAIQAKVADAPKPEVVTLDPYSFAAHRDATNLPLPLKQVSPSSSPDGCCGSLRTTCAPTMSNLVPAALIPLPFALEPEPPVEGRSRPTSTPSIPTGPPPSLFCIPLVEPYTAASPSCPGTRGEFPPSPCCGPGHRAEAG